MSIEGYRQRIREQALKTNGPPSPARNASAPPPCTGASRLAATCCMSAVLWSCGSVSSVTRANLSPWLVRVTEAVRKLGILPRPKNGTLATAGRGS
jgi:hypothetical protein